MKGRMINSLLLRGRRGDPPSLLRRAQKLRLDNSPTASVVASDSDAIQTARSPRGLVYYGVLRSP